MTDCNRCGDCCENIWIDTTKADLRGIDQGRNARFILAHWHSAGRRKGEGNHHRWSCDRFDPETRLCLAHDERPPICEGFPWYGQNPYDHRDLALSERCSFRADWQPVTFRRPGPDDG